MQTSYEDDDGNVGYNIDNGEVGEEEMDQMEPQEGNLPIPDMYHGAPMEDPIQYNESGDEVQESVEPRSEYDDGNSKCNPGRDEACQEEADHMEQQQEDVGIADMDHEIAAQDSIQYSENSHGSQEIVGPKSENGDEISRCNPDSDGERQEETDRMELHPEDYINPDMDREERGPTVYNGSSDEGKQDVESRCECIEENNGYNPDEMEQRGQDSVDRDDAADKNSGNEAIVHDGNVFGYKTMEDELEEELEEEIEEETEEKMEGEMEDEIPDGDVLGYRSMEEEMEEIEEKK